MARLTTVGQKPKLASVRFRAGKGACCPADVEANRFGMSSSLFFGEHVVFVSNRRFTSLTEFALKVAASIATTAEDRSFVDRFNTRMRAFFPGIDLDLEELFTSSSERAFWAAAFSELANWIDRREIGNPDQHEWRSSAISEAQRIAAMLRPEC